MSGLQTATNKLQVFSYLNLKYNDLVDDFELFNYVYKTFSAKIFNTLISNFNISLAFVFI